MTQTQAEPSPPPGLRLALLSGLLLWLACPPARLWPLAWVAVAPLIVSALRADRFRQAFWRGYAAGCLFLGLTWYWIGLTIVDWTQSPIGWLAWLALTLLMALHYGLWAGVAWWLGRRAEGAGQWLLLAASWVVMEWGRALGSFSMPWMPLGSTQYLFPPVLQIADTAGGYGVGFLLMLVNAGAALWFLKRGEADSARFLASGLTLATLALLYGVMRLGQPETGRPLTVAVMQGNFHPKQADEAQARQTFSALTARAAATLPPPALFLWSESSAPFDALHDAPTHDFLRSLAQTYRAPLLVGSAVQEPGAGKEYNAAVLFPADAGEPTRYNKRHIVPFGEYIPFRHLFPAFLANAFQFFERDLVPGEEPTVLRFTTPEGTPAAVGPLICYEAVYPPLARALARNGANLLVNQSNDYWQHSRFGMEQHVASVALRAVENRRWMPRATTTGITCVIDSAGRIRQRAPLDTPAFLTQTVFLEEGRTLYTRFGDWLVALCGLALLWRAGRETLSPQRRRDTGDSQKKE